MKGFTYADVKSMPTHERRYYLGLYTKEVLKREEQFEEQKNNSKSGKGKRKTSVSGNQLKNKIKTGEIPLK